MDKEFYTISVYVDKDENLIGIPCGESDKYGIADIDTVLLLKAPYTDKQIESYIEKVISACYTKKQGFVNATADFSMISIVKTKVNYSLMPTFNDPEKGPLAIDDDERILPLNYKAGELAEIIKDFIQIYLKANMFYKEIQELEEEKKNKDK